MYVDSQAALRALDNYVVKHKTVRDCKKLLNELILQKTFRSSLLGILTIFMADKVASFDFFFH